MLMAANLTRDLLNSVRTLVVRMLTVVVAFGLLGSVPARGALVIDISRHSDGFTIWDFSGSATYSELFPGGKFAGGALNLIEEWKGSGAASDFVGSGGYNNYVVAPTSGSVSLSVATAGFGVQTDAIDGIHVDHDTTGDDFGVSLTGSDILLANNDIVSWSGSAVFAVDINRLNSGNFTFQNYGESVIAAGNPFGTLPLQINVSTVPEPASIGLLTAAAVGWVARRRRRSSRKAIGRTAVLSA
jgi:hypothetical protein